MTPIPPAESRQDRYAVRVIEELRRLSALMEEMLLELRGAKLAAPATPAPGREVVRKVTETRPDGRTVVNRVREVRP
jgi:hypothetical protein